MLTRWNPMRELAEFDRMFNRFWNDSRVYEQEAFGTVPAIDLKENDNAFVMQAELPGFTPEQIDVRVENGVLFLKGKRETEEKKDEEGQYHLHERRSTSFERAFRLPSAVDTEKAEAQFENGVLTLTLPKSPEAQPKRINVTPSKQIEAKAQR
ncbi:MAG: Hsp20/alpha crystallin family protein [Anaerolineae bacterium]|nr:Hsp20/alpha crystallin family protein [Anaerolineae bacterium]